MNFDRLCDEATAAGKQQPELEHHIQYRHPFADAETGSAESLHEMSQDKTLQQRPLSPVRRMKDPFKF